MDITEFKRSIDRIQKANNAVKTVNIITPSGTTRGIDQLIQHNVVYSGLASQQRNSLTPELQLQALKMLNWRNVKADYYVWLDSDITLIHPRAIEWMISNISHNPMQMALFSSHERSSITQEAKFLNSSKQCPSENVKAQVEEYTSDVSFIDDTLFLTSAIVFKGELIENKYFNPMLDWYLETASRTIADQLSLPYILHKHDISVGSFDENILENILMRQDKYDTEIVKNKI